MPYYCLPVVRAAQQLLLLLSLLQLTVSTASCAIVHNYNYLGSDLTGVSAPTTSACCNICQKTAACKSWSFYRPQHICRLKSASFVTPPCSPHCTETEYDSGGITDTPPTPSPTPSPAQNASDWWFVRPVPDPVVLVAQQSDLMTGEPAGLTLKSGVMSFVFELVNQSVLLRSVWRYHCPATDCNGASPVFSFPGKYRAQGAPQPVSFDAMATIDLDHRKTFLGVLRADLESIVPPDQRWTYSGHSFRPSTQKRFHWVPGRRGAENLLWPPPGGALSLNFTFPCANLPQPKAGHLKATLTYELYRHVIALHRGVFCFIACRHQHVMA